MSQPVDADVVEIIFAKIQLKSAFETFDSFLKLVLAQGSDCSCCLFKMFSRSHQPVSLKNYCFLSWVCFISIVLSVEPLL